MKHYFFRDINKDDNFSDGKTFHAAGYVEKLYCEIGKPNIGGKDVAVSFFNPFEGIIESEWRGLVDVELYEVPEWEYELLVKNYNAIDALIGLH
jgi:hypothetical protein